MSVDSQKEMHWSRIREAGTLSGLRFLKLVHDYFGRGPVSFCLAPTALYFVLFRPTARKSSLAYLRQHAYRYPDFWQKAPGIFSTIKHFYTFAQSVVDKLMAWCTPIEEDRFMLSSPEAVETLMADARGQLVIGSHFGNLEFCRGFIKQNKDKVINILVHDKHSVNYNTLMNQLNPDSRLNIFQVEDFDVSAILSIKQKIDAGEWVFIAGDRTPLSGDANTVPVDFLGKTARFPVGPYLLGKGLGCPIKLMFSYCDYYAKDQPVYFDLINFCDRITLSRNDKTAQLTTLAQQFATELEKQCAKAPYHWFNFYDFWANNNQSNETSYARQRR